MCKALEDMMADARQDGEQSGYLKGEQNGYLKGEQSGYLKGEQSGYLKGEQNGYLKGEQSGQRTGQLQAKQDIAFNLSKMGLSVEQIAAAVEQSVGVITKWLENGPMLAK